MGIKLANNASSRLAASLSVSDTSVSLLPGDGAKFPGLVEGDFFMLTAVTSSGQWEIMKCTARNGDVLTVERAQEGTAPRAFNAGDIVQNRFTAGSLQAAVDAVSAPMQQSIEEMESSISSKLEKENNLSDLVDPSAARENLGIGSNALGNRTISTDEPSGGADKDIWFMVM